MGGSVGDAAMAADPVVPLIAQVPPLTTGWSIA
jgi:hypothetical protein